MSKPLEEEDVSELKLGSGTIIRKLLLLFVRSFASYWLYCVDFQEAQCLLNSEVAILLETSQQAEQDDTTESEQNPYVSYWNNNFLMISFTEYFWKHCNTCQDSVDSRIKLQ